MNCHKRIFTLIVLAAVLLWGGTGAVLGADNRGHGAPADALPRELKGVDVKDYFLPGKAREAGVVQTAMGHVVVARGDLRQAYFAMNGDRLYEQDVVFTLKAAKCRIKLLNNDIITLGDRTRIALKEVSVAKGATEKKTSLSMARGQAMFYAIRVLSQKTTSMTVETPTTVAGVRGTKFGMEVAVAGENNTAALPLLLADASADWGRYLILAQAPPTPNVTTTVHGFDGTVTVTSTVDGRTQSVGAGQTVSATPQGVGAVMPTPPQVAQRFQAATDVPPPAGSGSGSGGSQSSSGSSSSQSSSSSSGNAPDEKKSTDNTGTANTNTPDTSNITQQQNVNKEEEKAAKKETAKDPVADPKTNASATTTNHRVGYFASMLSNTTNGTLEEVFASQNRYDGESNVWARGTKNAGTDYTRALGGGRGSNPTVKWVVFDSGTKNSGELNASISSTTLGENYNMEWGYATVPTAFTVDSINYAFNNRVYWIFGIDTPGVRGFTGSAIYAGRAYGTYWSAAGGVNMSGTFNSEVNFTTAWLSNFGLHVSGGGASASIEGASGAIGTDAHFALTGGTWNLNGVTPDQTSAAGSIYGSDGASMGGVWAMYSSTYKTGAVGNFGGTSAEKGHYGGILKNCSNSYVDTYLTTSIQDFRSSSAQATNGSANTTVINGTPSPKNMVKLDVNAGTWTGTNPVTFKQLNANEYMSWGTWTQTNAMAISGTNYYFNDKGAYVWGNPTTVDEMSTLKQNAITGTYSGPAWGTYTPVSGSGTDMTGTFSGTINFASPAVTSFNVNVSGGGNSVVITNAVGSFTGGTSTFTINPNSGTWQINNTDAANKGASGTVYGNGTDKGKHVGGVWKAGITEGAQAVGGFQGTK